MLDVYRIGVTIALTNNVSSVLRVIQKDLFGLGKTVDLTTGKFGALERAAVGAMQAIAGIGTVKLAFDAAKIGDQFVQAQNRLLATGVNQLDVVAYSTAAQRAAIAVPGALPSGALQLATELRASLGGNAAEVISILQPALRELIGLHAEGVNITAQSFAQNIKALDLMGGAMKGGKFNPATFAKNLHYLDTLEVASGGLITPSTVLQFARLGGFTVQGTNFQRTMSELFTPIMELGSRAGSGAAQAAMQLLGGNASIKTINGMQQYHLIGPGGYVHEAGHYAVKPGALYGYKDLMDPNKGFSYWIQHDLVPLLNHDGVNSTTGVIAALSQVLGSVRAARFLMSTTTPSGQALQTRDMGIYNAAAGADPYAAAQGNLSTNLTNLSTAWTGFVQAIGAPLVPVAVKDLRAITSVVLDLENAAWAHPDAVKMMGEIAAGLGVMLTVMGTIKVAGAAFAATRGTFTALFGTSGVIFEALSPEGWLVLGVGALAHALSDMQKNFVPALPMTPDQQRKLLNHSPAKLLFPGLGHNDPSFPPSFTPPGAPPPGKSQGGKRLGMNDLDEDHLALLADWIGRGAPMTVTNPGDIHNGTAKAIAHQLSGRQGGTSGFDYSLGLAPVGGAFG